MLTKFKTIFYLLILSSCFFAVSAFAQEGQGLAGVADTVTQSFSSIGKLMIAVAYLAGIGFVLASLFKFKQHKDNPQQIPLGTPLAMLVIGVILVFLPMIFEPAGETVFGTDAKAGGYTGAGHLEIPGAEDTTGGGGK